MIASPTGIIYRNTPKESTAPIASQCLQTDRGSAVFHTITIGATEDFGEWHAPPFPLVLHLQSKYKQRGKALIRQATLPPPSFTWQAVFNKPHSRTHIRTLSLHGVVGKGPILGAYFPSHTTLNKERRASEQASVSPTALPEIRVPYILILICLLLPVLTQVSTASRTYHTRHTRRHAIHSEYSGGSTWPASEDSDQLLLEHHRIAQVKRHNEPQVWRE